jgi:hypothetical protein
MRIRKEAIFTQGCQKKLITNNSGLHIYLVMKIHSECKNKAICMASNTPKGTRNPFQDISNTQSLGK